MIPAAPSALTKLPLSPGVAVVLCKVTRAGVQFRVHLSLRIRSLFPAVQLSCLKPFCQLAESAKCTQPTDHHSSIGLAAFRHENWTGTESRCLIPDIRMCEGDLTLVKSSFVLSPVFYRQEAALYSQYFKKINGSDEIGDVANQLCKLVLLD